MSYTGSIESFQELVAEAQQKADAEGGPVIISVPEVHEEINDEFLNKRIFIRNGIVECQLTWQNFSKPQWIEAMQLLKARPDITKLHLEHGTMEAEVTQKLAENVHLIELTIETMTVDSEAAKAIARSTSIKRLSFVRFWSETPLSGDVLSAFATENKSITSFLIRDMNVEFSGVETLLSKNGNIAELGLMNVTLSDHDYVFLFSKANDVTALQLYPDYECPIKPDAMEALAANKTLQKLSISYSKLSLPCMEWLVQNQSISDLNLDHMDLTDEHIAIIAQSTTITRLSLKGNSDLTAASGQHLANNTTLKFLCIDQCAKIGPDGLESFLGNTTLEEIIIATYFPKKKDKFYQAADRVTKWVENNKYRNQNNDE